MKKEFYALTGLRGFAAVWITIGHTIFGLNQVFDLSHFTQEWLRLSWIAVEIFFVLSGFVMAHTYPKGVATLAAYGRFMGKRFARIYPLYIVCFLLWVWFLGAQEWGEAPTAGDFIKHMLLMQTWSNYTHYVWLDPAWSLSSEWGSYVLFFLFTGVLRMKNTKELLWWLALLTCGYVVFNLAFANNNMRMIIQCGVFRALPCFVIGLMLYRLRQNVATLPRYFTDALVVAFLFFGSLIIVTGLRGFWLFPLCVALVFGLTYPQGAFHKLMETRLLLFFGHISYALYITHYLVFQLLYTFLGGKLEWTLFPPLYVGFVLVAWLAHVGLEKPVHRFLVGKSVAVQ